jgi:hypothetical protein
MKKTIAGLLAAALVAGVAVAQDAKKADEAKKPDHIVVTPLSVAWSPGPPDLPKGLMMSVIQGDPGQAAPFTLRAKLPAGYKVAPHFHPADENVTVLSGTFAVGMGDKFDAAALKDLPVGAFASMPAEMHHFAMAKTACILQIHGVGPFKIVYVNPADDPSQAAPAKATTK